MNNSVWWVPDTLRLKTKMHLDTHHTEPFKAFSDNSCYPYGNSFMEPYHYHYHSCVHPRLDRLAWTPPAGSGCCRGNYSECLRVNWRRVDLSHNGSQGLLKDGIVTGAFSCDSDQPRIVLRVWCITSFSFFMVYTSLVKYANRRKGLPVPIKSRVTFNELCSTLEVNEQMSSVVSMIIEGCAMDVYKSGISPRGWLCGLPISCSLYKYFNL